MHNPSNSVLRDNAKHMQPHYDEQPLCKVLGIVQELWIEDTIDEERNDSENEQLEDKRVDPCNPRASKAEEWHHCHFTLRGAVQPTGSSAGKLTGAIVIFLFGLAAR